MPAESLEANNGEYADVNDDTDDCAYEYDNDVDDDMGASDDYEKHDYNYGVDVANTRWWC